MVAENSHKYVYKKVLPPPPPRILIRVRPCIYDKDLSTSFLGHKDLGHQTGMLQWISRDIRNTG